MTKLALFFLLAGCTNRALDVPIEPAPEPPTMTAQAAPPEACCRVEDEVWYCKDDTCPELKVGEECTTLGVGDAGNFCQVPLTDYCVPVYLERTTTTTGHAAFQTVYCF